MKEILLTDPFHIFFVLCVSRKEELKRLAEEDEKDRQRQILAEKKRQEELEKLRLVSMPFCRNCPFLCSV